MRARIVIAPEGTVRRVVLVGAFADTDVAPCVVEAIYAARFRPAARQTIVAYPVKLRPFD